MKTLFVKVNRPILSPNLLMNDNIIVDTRKRMENFHMPTWQIVQRCIDQKLIPPCIIVRPALFHHHHQVPSSLRRLAVMILHGSRSRNFFPTNAPGMGRFQLLNLGGLGYGLELRFWVVIAIIVSLTLTLITTLTII